MSDHGNSSYYIPWITQSYYTSHPLNIKEFFKIPGNSPWLSPVRCLSSFINGSEVFVEFVDYSELATQQSEGVCALSCTAAGTCNLHATPSVFRLTKMSIPRLTFFSSCRSHGLEPGDRDMVEKLVSLNCRSYPTQVCCDSFFHTRKRLNL